MKQTITTNPTGYLNIVLHAHLPFIRHPETSSTLEETWLYESLTETFLPLLMIFENLESSGIPFQLTISISPIMCTMLTAPTLQERYATHLSQLVNLATKEIDRTRKQHDIAPLSQMYYHRFLMLQNFYEKSCKRDVIAFMSDLQQKGLLEIIPCALNSIDLPNSMDKNLVDTYLQITRKSYNRFFKCNPVGLWLPDHVNLNEFSNIIAKNQFTYCITDSQLFTNESNYSSGGIYTPLLCNNAPLSIFGRDQTSAHQVFDLNDGYFLNAAYRDYYRDIGFDLDFEYISNYTDSFGFRTQTGIKYYRQEGTGKQKKVYDRQNALRLATENAGNYMFNRERQVLYLKSIMDSTPIITLPFNMLSLGRPWFEGPDWLNFLIRKIAFEQKTIQLVTASKYLKSNYPNENLQYSSILTSKESSPLHDQIHQSQIQLTTTLKKIRQLEPLEIRVTNQMVRELLLAESIDWLYMANQDVLEYALKRTRIHLGNFARLFSDLQNRAINKNYVSLLESNDNIFPEMDISTQ